MKAIKNLIATLVSTFMSLPYLLFAQDEGTYIDNLGVQDSSYMEQDMLTEGANGGGSVSIIIYIIIIVIIIGAVVYFMKNRKK